MLWDPEVEKKISSGGFGGYPNGNGKFNLFWFDESDEKIAELTFFDEMNYHVNKYNGNNF